MPVYLIPVVVKFDWTDCQTPYQNTFDPGTKVSNGETAIQNTIDSPVFTSINFTQGQSTNSQYLDAFQRSNFWGVVSSNTSYHTVLNPTLMTAQNIEVPSNDGRAQLYPPYGGCVGGVNPAWFAGQILSLLDTLEQTQDLSNGLALFLVYDVFAGQAPEYTPGGGGYHGWSLTPGLLEFQTYAWAAYNGGTCYQNGNQVPCPFADVTDVTHEVGEWFDDPRTTNRTGCAGDNALEVGDGSVLDQKYPYRGQNNFVYHLQDLKFLPYFRASGGTSWGPGWLSFQQESLTPCQ